MGRSNVIAVCFALLAPLSGPAWANASVDTSGSLSLIQAESVVARQSVVTGATGIPATVEIARNITLSTLAPASSAITAAATSFATANISTTNVNSTSINSSNVAAPTTATVATTNPAIPSIQESAVRPLITPKVEVGTIQQASFVISGDQDRSVSIAIPNSVPLTRIGGGEDVKFDTASSLDRSNIGQSRLTAETGGSGQLAFNVGGKVDMKDNVVAGAYAGVLRVTVQYN